MSRLLEMEMEAVLEVSKDNIVITDGEGTVLRASSSCYAIYGVPADQLIGRSVFELDEEQIFSPSVTVRVLRHRKEVQVMQKTKTGKLVMATGFPVFDEQGEIVRVISISHDLTEIEQLKADYEQLKVRMMQYETEIGTLRGDDDVIVKSKAVKRIYELINRVAQSDATVLFLGESGVGKSMFARKLHQHSPRKDGPFIEINCSAIPEALFESELFGYERGAFTGAHKQGKPGLIELADTGTLFLDEIGELPLSMQAKLLKVIQEKKITRIGGTKERHVDFRLIASTNRNLEQKVKEGTFREDLFYRIHVIPIEIPPLRERRDDIPRLCHYYLRQLNKTYGTKKVLHPHVLDVFMRYRWPGNVRELENLMERLVITSEDRVLQLEHLPQNIVRDSEPAVEEREMITAPHEPPMTLKQALQAVEKEWLKRAYRQCQTTYEMADYLGISQPSVIRKLKRYNINPKTNHNTKTNQL